ncbi:hypothetical protein Pelo_16788 [Pelomyxa schiedti]|nr:hypothetical protein Pelo_16788 [Pelomyxa schiedti]
MNVLFVAALFVAACGATWRETKYYPYNYYYDYSTSPYTEVEHCSDQYDEIYVTLELLDSDETCTSEECDTGGHYNEIISCLDTVPDFSTYFTNYHLITLWDDLDDQCEGDVTNYFVYNKDACEYCYDTSGYEAWYVYYWTCDVFSHAMVEWQQSVSGSGEACGTSTYDYTWEPTEYYDYRMGDCIGDSYEGWYKVHHQVLLQR